MKCKESVTQKIDGNRELSEAKQKNLPDDMNTSPHGSSLKRLAPVLLLDPNAQCIGLTVVRLAQSFLCERHHSHVISNTKSERRHAYVLTDDADRG